MAVWPAGAQSWAPRARKNVAYGRSARASVAAKEGARIPRVISSARHRAEGIKHARPGQRTGVSEHLLCPLRHLAPLLRRLRRRLSPNAPSEEDDRRIWRGHRRRQRFRQPWSGTSRLDGRYGLTVIEQGAFSADQSLGGFAVRSEMGSDGLEAGAGMVSAFQNLSAGSV